MTTGKRETIRLLKKQLNICKSGRKLMNKQLLSLKRNLKRGGLRKVNPYPKLTKLNTLA
jgi:hypothetical protein